MMTKRLNTETVAYQARLGQNPATSTKPTRASTDAIEDDILGMPGQ
jgi:hypothetical protein